MKLLGKIIYAIEKDNSFLDGFKESESDEMYKLLMSLPDVIKDLQHHKDTTIGLWATDRPDLIEDPKSVLFEIK